MNIFFPGNVKEWNAISKRVSEALGNIGTEIRAIEPPPAGITREEYLTRLERGMNVGVPLAFAKAALGRPLDSSEITFIRNYAENLDLLTNQPQVANAAAIIGAPNAAAHILGQLQNELMEIRTRILAAPNLDMNDVRRMLRVRRLLAAIIFTANLNNRHFLMQTLEEGAGYLNKGTKVRRLTPQTQAEVDNFPALRKSEFFNAFGDRAFKLKKSLKILTRALMFIALFVGGLFLLPHLVALPYLIFAEVSATIVVGIIVGCVVSLWNSAPKGKFLSAIKSFENSISELPSARVSSALDAQNESYTSFNGENVPAVFMRNPTPASL